jgi:uncharacterized membrane protein YfcA
MALLAVLLVSAVAGGFGSMVGIGGGLIMVPVLSQVLGYDIKVAIAASLIGVIAGSISASPRFLASGIADRRVAVTLLVATVIGGLTGGVTGTFLDGRVLALLFGVLLLLVAAQMAYQLRPFRGVPVVDPSSTPPTVAAFDSSYVEPRTGEVVVYGVQRLRAGAGLSFVAGNVSGLLGVGGGVINVPTMNVLMNVPLRVATTTSTLMLGATAMTSAMVAAASGTLDPLLAAPVVLGVLVGSRLGARLSMRVSQTWLSIMFICVALFFAGQTFVRLL